MTQKLECPFCGEGDFEKSRLNLGMALHLSQDCALNGFSLSLIDGNNVPRIRKSPRAMT